MAAALALVVVLALAVAVVGRCGWVREENTLGMSSSLSRGTSHRRTRLVGVGLGWVGLGWVGVVGVGVVGVVGVWVVVGAGVWVQQGCRLRNTLMVLLLLLALPKQPRLRRRQLPADSCHL